MNKIYFLIISTIVISTTANTLVRAAFIPQAKLEQVVIKIADFVPPPEVDFIFTTKYFLPILTKLEWNKVLDFGDQQSGVKYRLKFDSSIYETPSNFYLLNLSEFQDGEHKVAVSACDVSDNCSVWSSERIIIIDKSPPQIDVLDQKRSGDRVYGYLKLKLRDNNGLNNFSVSPVVDGGTLSFFDEGYFYDSWKSDFRDDFWVVVQLLNNQLTTHLKIWDEAGNMTEEEIAW